MMQSLMASHPRYLVRGYLVTLGAVLRDANVDRWSHLAGAVEGTVHDAASAPIQKRRRSPWDSPEAGTLDTYMHPGPATIPPRSTEVAPMGAGPQAAGAPSRAATTTKPPARTQDGGVARRSTQQPQGVGRDRRYINKGTSDDERGTSDGMAAGNASAAAAKFAEDAQTENGCDCTRTCRSAKGWHRALRNQ